MQVEFESYISNITIENLCGLYRVSFDLSNGIPGFIEMEDKPLTEFNEKIMYKIVGDLGKYEISYKDIERFICNYGMPVINNYIKKELGNYHQEGFFIKVVSEEVREAGKSILKEIAENEELPFFGLAVKVTSIEFI